MDTKLEEAIENQNNEIDNLKEMQKILLENGYYETAEEIQRKIEKLRKQVKIAKEIEHGS